MFLCVLLSQPGQSLSLDHVNSVTSGTWCSGWYISWSRLGYKPLCLHTAVCKGFFSPLAGHFESSSGSITLTARNGTIDLLKNGYFSAIQVKYVEMLMVFCALASTSVWSESHMTTCVECRGAKAKFMQSQNPSYGQIYAVRTLKRDFKCSKAPFRCCFVIKRQGT